jgi:endonuclease III-like uncharacterized protein
MSETVECPVSQSITNTECSIKIKNSFLGNRNYILAQQTQACKFIKAVDNFKEKGSFSLSFMLFNTIKKITLPATRTPFNTYKLKSYNLRLVLFMIHLTFNISVQRGGVST